MPSVDFILSGLTRISNMWMGVAVLWHLAVLVVLGAMIPEIRMRQRLGATLLTLPLLSVVAGAVAVKLWFNALVFSALFAALFVLARRMPAERIHAGARWTALAGVAGVLYGLVYPHFLAGQPLYAYAVAAPFGLVPCPTLATLLGFTLLAGGFDSRPWALVLGVAGLFYGIVGTAVLGVRLDVGLIALAALTVVYALLPMRQSGFHAAAPRP